MNLDAIAEIAGRADGEARVADQHYANALDAQGQLRSRHAMMGRAIEQLDRGEHAEARDTIAAVHGHCPSPENIETWFNESRALMSQAASTRAELAEAIVKLREVEATRVRHGGEA